MVLDKDNDSELPDWAVDEEELDELDNRETPLDLAEDTKLLLVKGCGIWLGTS